MDMSLYKETSIVLSNDLFLFIIIQIAPKIYRSTFANGQKSFHLKEKKKVCETRTPPKQV